MINVYICMYVYTAVATLIYQNLHKKLTGKRGRNRLIMASTRENFDLYGPLHLLNSLDWRNTFHRRSLAASLVQGVYILERDRQRGSHWHEHDARASPWWQRFHFQLNHPLVDDTDSSYFGAIFELKHAPPVLDQLGGPYPPRFVVAFRGTIATRSDDLKLNLKCILDKLEETSRFRSAFESVWNTVAMAGPANVWLAGHSLGASIAMLAGKNMAKSRFQLETYLFNPPFISVPIEYLIKNETLKHGVRIAGSLVTAGIATAMNRRGEDPFVVLAAWTPYLFVNPSDPICAEYIGYFEHREKMEGMGVGRIERIATRYSIACLVSGVMRRESEPLHLLPTAYMTVNLSPPEDIKQAHGIHQWWQHHFQWHSKLHKFH